MITLGHKWQEVVAAFVTWIPSTILVKNKEMNAFTSNTASINVTNNGISKSTITPEVGYGTNQLI